MLAALSIRNIVLIEALDLNLGAGLNVLTGETGAGKSILLDSLGLALGDRADRTLVRAGEKLGSVTAIFDLPIEHAVFDILKLEGFEVDGGELILRRQITNDGKSRAWINDQPAGQTMLNTVGISLVEIHGQHDDRGMLNRSAHRGLLDAYGNYSGEQKAVFIAWGHLKAARLSLETAKVALLSAQDDEDFLRHAVHELDLLDPLLGEETALADKRGLMMQGEKLATELSEYYNELTAKGGADAAIRSVVRRMDRSDDRVRPYLTEILETFDRAAIELSEGIGALERLMLDMEFNQSELEDVEERLFELRRIARKHHCKGDDLPALHTTLSEKLVALDAGDEAVQIAEKALKIAEAEMQEKSAQLTAKRKAAAKKMDALINAELAPLKLETATFRTQVNVLSPDYYGPDGVDSIEFEVQTNPATDFGTMVKIASGGELARFILALKVVLASNGSLPVMVFDEVDKGVGGATADAVGERLARLASDVQVLVVTHSPQVASRGNIHYLINKGRDGGVTRTDVRALTNTERLEEIARMLSGATISNEARAAAAKLLV